MSKHILWVDTETTGLVPNVHGVHQVAGIIDSYPLQESKPCLREFDILANPLVAPYSCPIAEWDENGITRNTLSVSGVTEEQVMAYPDYARSFKDLVSVFDEYIDKFNRSDKFILAGYNVGYDKDMLAGWAKNVGNKFLFSYIDHKVIDVQSIVRAVYAMGLFHEEPADFKLETIAKLFNIEIDAHDALSDIQATRALFFKMVKIISESVQG